MVALWQMHIFCRMVFCTLFLYAKFIPNSYQLMKLINLYNTCIMQQKLFYINVFFFTFYFPQLELF